MVTKALPPDRRLQRIINKNADLERIDVSFSHHGVSVRAVPNSFHPIVAERRALAFAERNGSITVQEATEINNNALMVPVVSVFAPNLAEAVAGLETQMKKRVAD